MDLNARWEKVLHDIWSNKARSALVIATIAIGIAAVGMINNTVRMMKRDLFGQFAERNPASILIYASPFPDNLADGVSAMREVQRAEAQRSTDAFILGKHSEWISLNLLTFPDFKNVQINHPVLESGSADPGLRGILLERSSASALGLQPGDSVLVKMPDEKETRLEVRGIVHDMTEQPYNINQEVLGYVDMSTLEWLGQSPYYNQIKLLVAEGKSDREHVLEVAALARDRVIEPAGYQVSAMQVPGSSGRPGEFWARKQVDGVLLVLQLMSILAILLSAGLVVNTISAVLLQQVKQIGVMRSVGAVRSQIVQIYLVYVLVLSVAGTLLALPLGMLGAWGLTYVAGWFMNFNVSSIDLPSSLLLLQLALGILMPVGVALFPIWRGTRISVYDAIYQYGLGGNEAHSQIDNLLLRLRHLSPPVLLSLRNTFRNRPRLAFTLATLVVAGAMFMAVFSSYSTLGQEVHELGRYIAFDVTIGIPGGANRRTVEREALRVPGVGIAEGWGSTNGVIVNPDGSESDRLEIVGVPEDSQTVQPSMVKGRWLQAGDQAMVVLNEDLLTRQPGIQVGDQIELKVNDTRARYTVAGIASKHLTSARAYLTFPEFDRLTGRYNQVDLVRVLATPGQFSAAAQQKQLGQQLEKRFEDAQLSQSSSKTRSEIFSSLSQAFNILLVILMLVAVILAVIGGLGLTGAMGMSVLERTREIGVLRAVGASHNAVRQVVVVEGIAVAWISWLLSALVSYPVGWALASALIYTAFGTQATFRYSLLGLFAWLLAVTLIGIFSCLTPARRAAKLTVREVLNYE
jgi:putative ABC transport system permease protein